MRYGPAVQFEYVDLSDAQNQARFSELFLLAEEQNLPYPLVEINGRLQMTGSAQYYLILPLVEQALEIEQARQ